jgi:glycerol-3-phosphate acyltransferase PlsY
MIKEIIFLFFSYLLGSIPFGYIFTKIFAKKNILEIGWRKTSGSNVFKNVGFLPGALTGIFDIAKGSFAVYLTKKFGLSPPFEEIAGLLAVIGHNWSCFLKFAGGRGIGTFLGVLLILSPKILILSLLPTLFLVLFLDTSIATIFFLFFSIFFSFKENLLGSVGLFPILSLFPIFLKRLSPIREISFKKPELIKNRLLFDDDFSHPIFKKLTKEKNFLK